VEVPQPPDPFCRDIQEAYQYMFYSLKNEHLDVVLVPAPSPQFEGHKIRVVQNRNPDWYQYACWWYGTDRVRRKRFIDYLSRIIKKDELHHAATHLINEIANSLILDGKFTDPYEGMEIDGELSTIPEPHDMLS